MENQTSQQAKLHLNIHYVATEFVQGQKRHIRRCA